MAATILAVDDSPVNLQLAKSILEPSGYIVLQASDVDLALQLVRSRNVDLILTDWHFKGHTARDFLEALQTDARTASIPCLVITASDPYSRNKVEAMIAGAAAYLLRPLEPATVLAEIQRTLQQGHQLSGH